MQYKTENREYQKVDIAYGTNIVGAVKQLQEYAERGEYACAEFNGYMLYSDSVTVDSAYLLIMGKTKAEFDREQNEFCEYLRNERAKREASVPELSKEWIERGHAILDEEYWEEWDKIVPIRLNDLYRGRELGDCLNIVQQLNSGCTLEHAKEIITTQNHSGMSFSLVCTMVNAFCKRGKEFVEFVNGRNH